MCIQTLFILDSSGAIIIEKHYRGIVNRQVAEQFWDEVQKVAPFFAEMLPVMATPKYYLIHVLRGGLFFLGVAARDVAPVVVVEFLDRTAKIFKQYFSDQLHERALKDNFITAYQLLEEMNDAGLPFNLEPNILEEMVSVPGLFSQATDLVLGPGAGPFPNLLPNGALTQIPWRRQNVSKTTNEIYIDFIEEIDAIIESNGSLVYSKISGTLEIDSQLAGLPDLVLKVLGATGIDDIGNHVQMPIYVKPQILIGEQTGTVHVMVGSKHIAPGDKEIEEIIVTIPFSKQCSGTNLTSKIGTVIFDETTKTCRWRIPQLPKNVTPILEGGFSFDPAHPPAKPTINMWAASGLKVDSLTLLNEKYNHFKGVRSVTTGGQIQIRC